MVTEIYYPTGKYARQKIYQCKCEVCLKNYTATQTGSACCSDHCRAQKAKDLEREAKKHRLKVDANKVLTANKNRRI